ncbi:MAG TPA: cadherin-like beta sandwich domain-containing protein, partial [Arthrobacter sp.]|nr:cadherin-like beta sandwich domain-containing protein [Arthrobacter sp.]
SNNKLSGLTVSVGSLTPSFAPTTLNYTVNVNGFTPSMTISATKQDPNAVMSASGSVIAPSGVGTGQVTVPLQGASIDVPITVIAQDGSPQIYRITVNRSF